MSEIEPNEQRMYKDLAYLWPIISNPADYATEASFWKTALRDKLGPGRHQILELGVGGGNNLSHLTDEFDAVGVDLSEGMLEHCRRHIPGIEVHVGDMRTVRLGRTFDAVLIHDAIDYMLNEDDLRATFRTAWEHLRPGGVFITAPDFLKETFPDSTAWHSNGTDGETILTHVEYYWDPDPNDSTAECHMTLHIRKGAELRVEHDRHVFGLFPRQSWYDLIAETGFKVESVEYPVHSDLRQAYLFVGVKP